jgi:hypothetical protein
MPSSCLFSPGNFDPESPPARGRFWVEIVANGHLIAGHFTILNVVDFWRFAFDIEREGLIVEIN